MELPKHALDDFKTDQAIKILREDRDRYKTQAHLWTPNFDITRDAETNNVIIIVKVRDQSKRFTLEAETIKDYPVEQITRIVVDEALEIFQNLLIKDLGPVFNGIKWNVEEKTK
jgi:hypothetical protein